MYQVFNMGHRLEVYLKPEKAETVLALAAELGLDARIVGRVEASDKKSLTISSPYGTFNYD